MPLPALRLHDLDTSSWWKSTNLRRIGKGVGFVREHVGLHALGKMTIMTKVENLMPELGEDMMVMVLASCVAVVLLEKTQSKGCLGGIGKGLKENDRTANSP